jgi:putative hydrolase of the HAD superfamily
VLDNAAPGDALLYVDDKDDNVRAFRELGVDGLVADPRGEWIRSVDAWLGTPSRSGR